MLGAASRLSLPAVTWVSRRAIRGGNAQVRCLTHSLRVPTILPARHNASDCDVPLGSKLQGDWSFGVKKELLDDARDMLRDARNESNSSVSCLDPADAVRPTTAHAARMPWRPSDNLGAVMLDEAPPH